MSCSFTRCSVLGRHMSGTSVALHQVVGKAQQLFAYPLSDETVPDKTEVFNFFSEADVNKTAVVGNLCGKIGTSSYSSCTRAVEGAWDRAEADACGAHLTGVICDASESSCFSDASELTPWSPCDFKSWCEWCCHGHHQRVCPTMVETGAKVTFEECGVRSPALRS